jgi:hypothetical protein
MNRRCRISLGGSGLRLAAELMLVALPSMAALAQERQPASDVTEALAVFVER